MLPVLEISTSIMPHGQGKRYRIRRSSGSQSSLEKATQGVLLSYINSPEGVGGLVMGMLAGKIARLTPLPTGI